MPASVKPMPDHQRIRLRAAIGVEADERLQQRCRELDRSA